MKGRESPWPKNAKIKPFERNLKGRSHTSLFLLKMGDFLGWGYTWGYKLGLHFWGTGVTKQGFGGV